MTAYGLVASLAWTAAAVLCLSRVNAFAHRWLDVCHIAKQAPAQIEIPNDLIALAMNESEKWAQDALLKVIRQRYDSLGDWNKVRSAVGVGELA